jgi:IclR family transcriptional regulator, acetate operon repressor
VPPPPDRRSGTQSIERALAVLTLFEGSTDDLGVSDIAQRTGLKVSTAHRLVRALCAGGVLVQDHRTERYALGPLLVVLGRRAEERLGFARALPAIEELADRTGESVNLGIRAGHEVLVVLHASSGQPLRFDQAAGTRVPAHTSAMGKCLLACSPDPGSVVDELPALRRLTDRTITDRDRLADDLETVRSRGWALNDGERDPGVRAVAAPVLDPSGNAIAAIAVQGPAIRLPDDRLEEVAADIIGTARRLAPLLAATSA